MDREIAVKSEMLAVEAGSDKRKKNAGWTNHWINPYVVPVGPLNHLCAGIGNAWITRFRDYTHGLSVSQRGYCFQKNRRIAFVMVFSYMDLRQRGWMPYAF